MTQSNIGKQLKREAKELAHKIKYGKMYGLNRIFHDESHRKGKSQTKR